MILEKPFVLNIPYKPLYRLDIDSGICLMLVIRYPGLDFTSPFITCPDAFIHIYTVYYVVVAVLWYSVHTTYYVIRTQPVSET